MPAPKPPPRLRPIHGRPPPHDLEAERAVISACLIAPERFEDVAAVLKAEDFYGDSHGLIWRVIGELHEAQAPIDTVQVYSRLRDTGRAGAVGGIAYLGDLVDATPSVSNVLAHARTVEEHSRARTVIARMQELVAEGYGERRPGYALEVARELQELSGADRARQGAVLAAWKPLPEEWLSTSPPPQTYLFRHPTKDGAPCPFGEGDGMIPLGRAGLLASEGGAGKTMVLLEAAVSLIAGVPWMGHFHPSWDARGGRVLLALGEENEEECHRRMYRACDALRLDPEARKKVSSRLVILPLAGKPVALLSGGVDGRIQETQEMLALRSRLRRDAGAKGWSLVVLDPLARWCGVDVESDNVAATRFVQAVESLCEVPGTPTVLVAHHSSKQSRREGTADSRGVTGLTDGFRWAGTLTRKRGEVHFLQTKSNLSRPMDEAVELVRGPGGSLRAKDASAQHHEETEEQERALSKEARATAILEARIDRAKQLVLATVRSAMIKGSPILSRSDLTALTPGKQTDKVAALTRLLQDGELVKTERGYELKNPEVPRGAK